MVDRIRQFACVALLLATGSCAHRVGSTVPSVITSETFVTVHGHPLRLHLSKPASLAAPGALFVYATGDAGWWGKDRDIFKHIKVWGYPAVGFSAREYVHHLGKDTLRPAEVARDYAAIIVAANTALGLPPGTRAVLVGKSRGAGLAVAAAGYPPLNAVLAGVMAVGLTREEEYVHGRVRGSRSRALVMLQPYSHLTSIGRVPVAVIQSTHDDYVPAQEARQLFGPDTPSRQLVPVESRDHNFGGALDLMYTQMERSMEWILHR